MTAEPVELRVDPDAWRSHGRRSSFLCSLGLVGNDPPLVVGRTPGSLR